MPKHASRAPAVPSSPQEVPLGDVLEFMRLLWAVDHRLQSVSKQIAARLGVTGPQRLVVRFVGLFPGVTSGRLSELLHLHPSTLTGVVQRLQRHGLLARRPDPADGRRALLRLTPAGQRLARASGPTVEVAIQHALARRSLAEIEATRSVLGSVAEELRVLALPGALGPGRPGRPTAGQPTRRRRA